MIRTLDGEFDWVAADREPEFSCRELRWITPLVSRPLAGRAASSNWRPAIASRASRMKVQPTLGGVSDCQE